MATQELRIDNYDSMMDANAELMNDIYHDGKLTTKEKLASFSIGVRNQVALSRDMAARRKELFGYGMKPVGLNTKSLTFQVSETDKEAKQ